MIKLSYEATLTKNQEKVISAYAVDTDGKEKMDSTMVTISHGATAAQMEALAGAVGKLAKQLAGTSVRGQNVREYLLQEVD